MALAGVRLVYDLIVPSWTNLRCKELTMFGNSGSRRRLVFLTAAVALLITNMGCAIKERRKALHPTDDLPSLAGLDGRSPWLKAHLPDGGLYVLAQWHVDENRRQITGNGTLFNARRDVTGAGPFTIPIDSVAIFESNIVQTSPAVVGLTVLSVASAGLTAYCIANPKACFGSCPTFYAGDETGSPALMAEGFSASVAPSLEATDLDALFRTTASEPLFTLTMTNEALETHVVRHADLLLAPRPPDGRVVAAADGTLWQTKQILPVMRCQGPEGDCTDLVARCDGTERYGLADSVYLDTKEYLELEFTDIPDGRLGLIVASRHTLLSTFLFYQGLAYLGENAVPALARINPTQELAQGSKTLGALLGKIDILVSEPGGDWSTAGSVGETGPLAVNVNMLRLPPWDRTDGRLRLRMTKGNWRCDYIALAVLGDKVAPQRVRPAGVLRDGADDPQALADLTSADRALVSLPGDRFDIIYQLPTAGTASEVFLESRGYYLEWMRDDWLQEEDPAKAALLFRFPELALSYLAPQFKVLEPDLEAHFWGSRYAR
jgi:hypothetical protein